MPLTPATTDKFQKVGLPGSATTLASPGYTIGNSGITVGSTTNHPTDTLYTFAVDQVQVINGVATRVAGTYCEFEGIVTSGTTIGSLALKYGNAQNYAAGALTRVYIPVSSNRENSLVDGLNQDHNGKGNHKNLTDDNGNTWLTRSQIASAVNSVQVANAAANGAPSLSAVGSDTNIDLQLNPKGTGVVKVDGSAPRQFFSLFNFIESGCVWSGNAYGSTLLASMTAGFVWIAGKRLTVAAIASRAFTASKDTYIDFQDNLDGTAKVVYTEVANNAASPVIPNSLADATNARNAIIISGATNILNAGSVNQGQETMVLPIASSIPYAVTDSLGNLICPRDPNRKILGYRQITSAFSVASVSTVQATGLTAAVTIPAGGRRVRVTFFSWNLATSAAGSGVNLSLWDGAVNSGTQVGGGSVTSPAGNNGWSGVAVAVVTASAGNKTYNLGVSTPSGTLTINASATIPASILVEAI